MNRQLTLSLVAFLLALSARSQDIAVDTVASFKGQQVTGITVNQNGKVFANFPRWRMGVTYSVVYLDDEGVVMPFPNKAWNSWEMGQKVSPNVFIAVQSVVASKGKLYVVDTHNPMFKGVIGAPHVYVFDILTHTLVSDYTLPKSAFHGDSYINDIRIDHRHKRAYLTDSGHAGLVVIDLSNGEIHRVLNDHYSTQAETNGIECANGWWENTVHADGIALDKDNEVLYFHALTGHSLYAVSTNALDSKSTKDIAASVVKVGKTPAPDGMIMGGNHQLYMGDLAANAIVQLDLRTQTMHTLVAGDMVRWADTFAIYNGYLYYTNSRINETSNGVSDMMFTINRLKLPAD